MEALVTASPEFFKGKKKSEVKAYFQEALDFIKQNQKPETIISAVVHMDEKTPHMVEVIPPEILQAAKRTAVHKTQEI